MPGEAIMFHNILINFANLVSASIECNPDDPTRSWLYLVTPHDSVRLPLPTSYDVALMEWRELFSQPPAYTPHVHDGSDTAHAHSGGNVAHTH